MITKPKFNGIRLEMQLRAESPMIHFQPNTPGATVRATEVKPKLDRFLLKKLMKETGMGLKELKEDPVYGGMFLKKEDDALKYKMQITAASVESYPVGLKTDYEIFYGNMGNNGKTEPKKAVFSDPKLTIQCFHQKVRELLEKYLNEFFLVTNFGTMQGKGFGSFVPNKMSMYELNEQEIKEISGYLKEMADGAPVYCMTFHKKTAQQLRGAERSAYSGSMFREIKDFYNILKSGMNFKGYAKSFVFRYMLEKKFGNEKALLKYKGLAPKVATSEAGLAKRENMTEPENPRYVRAMLGVGSTLTYREKGMPDVTINISNSEFERAASPIFFKIVGNVVFIVARKVPEALYDKSFTFSTKGKELKINTPTAAEFDIQDMLAQYIKYYNSTQLREKDLPNTKKYRKVVEIS